MKEKPHVFCASLIAFVLVTMQGWLGNLVVETELNDGMITIHMFMAQILVCLLLFAIF